MIGCQNRRCRHLAIVATVSFGVLLVVHMSFSNTHKIILSGSNMLYYNGNARVMYFANDSVAGVFRGKPQRNKESSPSTDKEAASLTAKKTETQADTSGQIIYGSMLLDLWPGCKGNLVDDLRMDVRFPKSPAKTSTVNVLKYATNEDNLGIRISGFVKPGTTGLYKFAIASDDTSELWLSTADEHWNLRKIACVGCIDQAHLPAQTLPNPPPTHVKEEVFTAHPLQISKAMSMSSDELYYMEVYLKNDANSGFVNVKWQTPDSVSWEDVPNSLLGHKQGVTNTEKH